MQDELENDTAGRSDDSGLTQAAPPIPADQDTEKQWVPVSDRKIRVGIIGYGVCGFGADFSFQDHPNVTVTAVADLVPEQCAALAKACRCQKMYATGEELIRDEAIEAVFIATDAPSHARLAIAALQAGKHVASAVPAVFGSLEDADALFAAARNSAGKYMMFETSYFHVNLYAMREMYRRGDLGKLIYAEGEYMHYLGTPLAAYGGWRAGLPPQWYPTHTNAYYMGVTGGSFTEVSCMGRPSPIPHLQAKNRYDNPFGTEIALFRTSEGSMARTAISWDIPGTGDETGRIWTEKGTFDRVFKGIDGKEAPLIKRPPLPPGVEPGGHNGSHGYLTNEFVEAILLDRMPLVDIAQALNLTVAGIVAHQSAMQNGELLKIPQYVL
ncbi:MAG: Gfo/Idh/MocA family oxidoreductase [Desulfobulbaceae bacterium]|nr:Gfo/Idh/MocA family oxidoreductase [Desulfobulbaceae bacterium]HIJ91540.1 Gfo/Idh/MocA family oxidoreductase [Deltaproteobacteria bacterium]